MIAKVEEITDQKELFDKAVLAFDHQQIKMNKMEKTIDFQGGKIRELETEIETLKSILDRVIDG